MPLIYMIAELSENAPTPFTYVPESPDLKRIGIDLDLIHLRKLRFEGQIAGRGVGDWTVTGKLGATVVQTCVVTLDPVTTRIEEDVARLFVKDWTEPEENEVEMADDDSIEPLERSIDIAKIAHEALALALPLVPKSEGASLDKTVFAAEGIAPLTDEAAKPFASLAEFRKKLEEGN